MERVFIGIDPGRHKCGLAVFGQQGKFLLQDVILLEKLEEYLACLLNKYEIVGVVTGDGTGAEIVQDLLGRHLDRDKIAVVNEKNTTLKARRRYFQENPPRGWRRLLPVSLQTPPEAVDGWAAVVILEKFFEKNSRFREERQD
ncbi:MAG: resolvase [Halanaerobium sp.]|nr:resolvase [Halanaerobium sp.]